jgi:hypothetical protein
VDGTMSARDRGKEFTAPFAEDAKGKEGAEEWIKDEGRTRTIKHARVKEKILGLVPLPFRHGCT